MDRQLRAAQVVLRALTPFLLLAVGCATSPDELPAAPATIEPVVTHGVGDGRYVTLEARPSAAAAELLPAGARYRAVLGADKRLALVVVGADQRLLGRLRVVAGSDALASAAARVEYEDIDGRAAQVEAWSFAGSIDGRAIIGARSASFRVRMGEDGSLAAERWSIAHGERSPELDELRRARAIGADLAALTDALARGGAFAEPDRRELTELLALAELALELSVRAWAGDDRSRLPSLAEFAPTD